MDSNRFRHLIAAVSQSPSRRSIARAVAGLGLSGILGARLALADAEAKKKGKNKKRKKKTCPTVACNDNVKNGDESDVDCGGSCNRCIIGKTCNGRDDCRSAFCSEGRCGQCSSSDQCGSDANGACRCEEVLEGPFAAIVCNSNTDPLTVGFAGCDRCAPNQNCVFVEDGVTACVLPCGATVG